MNDQQVLLAVDNARLNYFKLPDHIEIDFEKLWNLKPDTQQQIMYAGVLHNMPRYCQSYGKDYAFSGINHPALEIPEELNNILQWANTISPCNQILMNWYANGQHYIAAHSDDERQLVPGSPIISISLGGERLFRIREKKTKMIACDVKLQDRDVVVMEGSEFQNKFTHEIVKTAKKCNRRINMTLRNFE